MWSARMKLWDDHDIRISVIGLAGLRGVFVGLLGVLWQQHLDGLAGGAPLDAIALWFSGGAACAALLVALQRHPRRVLGLVPGGWLALTLAGVLWALNAGHLKGIQALVVGFGAGLIDLPLVITFWRLLPSDSRGQGVALRTALDLPAVVLCAGTIYLLAFAEASLANQLWLIAATSLLATLASFWVYRREVVEQILEVIFAIMYRFRAAGPGLDTFPQRGPVIVVANHSGYLDPMWLAKVLPRTMIPMMTAYFFDVWWMRWAMVYLADAIRVELPKFRREIPELKNAIAALDAGKCLVIFPEGRLRRTEDRPLSMFGQGVWHILRERPQTPVVVCWIEGGWGSYFSYKNGLPMKNKRLDIRHPIGIGIHEPEVLDAEILADQRRTRRYLMARCSAARAFLGLEPINVPSAETEPAEEPA